jgi:beta-phosphoglucomutase-like phosphatase (HAD superfamily)
VVFDTDGVITDSARSHAAARRKAFDACLSEREGQRPFDPVDARRLGLAGKPDPALFVEAARRLGVPVSDTAVVEDSLAGVEAIRRGGFGPAVGVDRTGGPGRAADLRRRGADIVVSDPGELLIGDD